MKTAIGKLTFVCNHIIIMILIFTTISIAAIDDKDIVAMWLMDEGKGNMAEDSSGNGNDGKFVGNLKWVNGKFGKGLEFDGADTWLECGNDPSLDFSDDTPFSIHAWVQSAGAPTGKCVIWKGLGCSTWSQYLLGTGAHENGDNGANVTFHIRAGNGGAKRETRGDDLPENEWVHLVGVYDGNSASIYKNGKLEKSEKIKGPPWASPEQVYIGADPGCGKRCQWEGIIDEVAVFNIALSDADVTALGRGLQGALAVDAVGKLAATWSQIKSNKDFVR